MTTILITFVTDRTGHDLRYVIDVSKIEKQQGWSPNESFESGIRKTDTMVSAYTRMGAISKIAEQLMIEHP